MGDANFSLRDPGYSHVLNEAAYYMAEAIAGLYVVPQVYTEFVVLLM